MNITHYDLFAGIGGFSLALEEVFNEAKINHIFCEWAEFPTAVLKKHWPGGIFYGDITDLIADTEHTGLYKPEKSRGSQEGKEERRLPQYERLDIAPAGVRGKLTSDTDSQRHKSSFTKSETAGRFDLCSGTGGDENETLTILTGGFPCQPFSHAGRRKGTADDRYQWPNMFRVIQNVKPDWVIAENVRGLVTWNDGMVLEQVCTDLEGEGYEVQPFIIPACAVNAPHRRDRIWIIAHRANSRTKGLQKWEINPDDTTDASSERLRGRSLQGCQDREWQMAEDERQRTEVRGQNQGRSRRDWNQDWREVAAATCNARMDDGFSRKVDGISYSFAKWRNESIKAYGNAIVPQVAMEIFRAIKRTVELNYTKSCK
nr:MAG TPA: Cytosine specific methyltransferase [Caudoviricetes sp.]